MALNNFRVGRPASVPENGHLSFKKKKKHWTLTYSPKAGLVARVQAEEHDYSPPPAGILLVEADVKLGQLDIWPLNTTAFAHFPFRPKYARPRLIRLEGMTGLEARSASDVIEILNKLPSGFVRSPHAGLGFDYELRAIPEILTEHDVDMLIVRSGRRDGLPSFDENRSLTVAKVQFDELRRAIRRVHEKALDIAGDEKDRIAFNQLLSVADPSAFPEKPPIYRKNGVVASIGVRSGDQLSNRDQTAILSAARGAVRSLSGRKPQSILQLSRDIEVVTLERLIEEMKRRLDRDKTERPWQKFFEQNPFILRLAFGYPVLKMGEQISVGGSNFDGKGEKIPDFVLKAAATGNLALVEIKAPEAALFGAKPYRGGVYAPEKELAGGVNQLLDQRHKLQASLPLKKQESGVFDVEAYAVDGILVIGRTPADRERQKSLELFRHDLKSVLVLTYDELLTKLENLLEFLQVTSAPAESIGGTEQTSGALHPAQASPTPE
ncbi:MAG TPA: Shedu anti-phage system protein SduA domain-containing protein [Allosphingosinicella sp.]|jgi:hypothetical protein